MTTAYRIQAKDGRGPYRPGFSQVWCDDDFAPGVQPLPTWMEEFGYENVVKRARRDEQIGSAVRAVGNLDKWFSRAEQERLAALGFFIACITRVRVLAESENQLVIARRVPFCKKYRVIPWNKETPPTEPFG